MIMNDYDQHTFSEEIGIVKITMKTCSNSCELNNCSLICVYLLFKSF